MKLVKVRQDRLCHRCRVRIGKGARARQTFHSTATGGHKAVWYCLRCRP